MAEPWYRSIRHRPWRIEGDRIVDDNGDVVAVMEDANPQERRLVEVAPELMRFAQECRGTINEQRADRIMFYVETGEKG